MLKPQIKMEMVTMICYEFVQLIGNLALTSKKLIFT
jgi:hypothetical protein